MTGYQIDDDVPLPKCGANGGLAKAARTAQRAAKPRVYDAYLVWLNGQGCYKYKTGFVDAMCLMFPEITDTETVMRWMREWERVAK